MEEASHIIKIVNVDSYMAPPIPNVDVTYSEFRSSAVNIVPVIRIFGSVPSGEKICLHIHGVFPYLYVPYDGKEDANRLMYQIASSIDKTINIMMNHASSNAQHVYKIVLVSGIPFYGYHPKNHQFFKIFLYNPMLVRKVSSLLQNENILGRIYQPHESHLSFALQFMIDYNLHGMSHVLLSEMIYRRSDDNSNDQDPENYMPYSVKRTSKCKLEADCLSEHILNQNEVSSGKLAVNPGISALWADEMQRRRNKQEDSQLGPFLKIVNKIFEPTKSHKLFERALQENLSMSPDSLTEANMNLSVYPAETPEDGTEFQNASLNVTHSQNETMDLTLDETIVSSQSSDFNCTVNEDVMDLYNVLQHLGNNVDEIEEDSILSQVVKEDGEEIEEELDFTMPLGATETPIKNNLVENEACLSDDDLWEDSLNETLKIPQFDGNNDEFSKDRSNSQENFTGILKESCLSLFVKDHKKIEKDFRIPMGLNNAPATNNFDEIDEYLSDEDIWEDAKDEMLKISQFDGHLDDSSEEYDSNLSQSKDDFSCDFLEVDNLKNVGGKGFSTHLKVENLGTISENSGDQSCPYSLNVVSTPKKRKEEFMNPKLKRKIKGKREASISSTTTLTAILKGKNTPSTHVKRKQTPPKKRGRPKKIVYKFNKERKKTNKMENEKENLKNKNIDQKKIAKNKFRTKTEKDSSNILTNNNVPTKIIENPNFEKKENSILPKRIPSPSKKCDCFEKNDLKSNNKYVDKKEKIIKKQSKVNEKFGIKKTGCASKEESASFKNNKNTKEKCIITTENPNFLKKENSISPKRISSPSKKCNCFEQTHLKYIYKKEKIKTEIIESKTNKNVAIKKIGSESKNPIEKAIKPNERCISLKITDPNVGIETKRRRGRPKKIIQNLGLKNVEVFGDELLLKKYVPQPTKKIEIIESKTNENVGIKKTGSESKNPIKKTKNPIEKCISSKNSDPNVGISSSETKRRRGRPKKIIQNSGLKNVDVFGDELLSKKDEDKPTKKNQKLSLINRELKIIIPVSQQKKIIQNLSLNNIQKISKRKKSSRENIRKSFFSCWKITLKPNKGKVSRVTRIKKYNNKNVSTRVTQKLKSELNHKVFVKTHEQYCLSKKKSACSCNYKFKAVDNIDFENLSYYKPKFKSTEEFFIYKHIVYLIGDKGSKKINSSNLQKQTISNNSANDHEYSQMPTISNNFEDDIENEDLDTEESFSTKEPEPTSSENSEFSNKNDISFKHAVNISKVPKDIYNSKNSKLTISNSSVIKPSSKEQIFSCDPMNISKTKDPEETGGIKQPKLTNNNIITIENDISKTKVPKEIYDIKTSKTTICNSSVIKLSDEEENYGCEKVTISKIIVPEEICSIKQPNLINNNIITIEDDVNISHTKVSKEIYNSKTSKPTISNSSVIKPSSKEEIFSCENAVNISKIKVPQETFSIEQPNLINNNIITIEDDVNINKTRLSKEIYNSKKYKPIISSSSVMKPSSKEEIFSCENSVNISKIIKVPEEICSIKQPKLITDDKIDIIDAVKISKTKVPNEIHISKKYKPTISNSSVIKLFDKEIFSCENAVNISKIKVSEEIFSIKQPKLINNNIVTIEDDVNISKTIAPKEIYNSKKSTPTISNSSVIKLSSKEDIFSCENAVNISKIIKVPEEICSIKQPKLITDDKITIIGAASTSKTKVPKEIYDSKTSKAIISNSSVIKPSDKEEIFGYESSVNISKIKVPEEICSIKQPKLITDDKITIIDAASTSKTKVPKKIYNSKPSKPTISNSSVIKPSDKEEIFGSESTVNISKIKVPEEICSIKQPKIINKNIITIENDVNASKTKAPKEIYDSKKFKPTISNSSVIKLSTKEEIFSYENAVNISKIIKVPKEICSIKQPKLISNDKITIIDAASTSKTKVSKEIYDSKKSKPTISDSSVIKPSDNEEIFGCKSNVNISKIKVPEKICSIKQPKTINTNIITIENDVNTIITKVPKEICNSKKSKRTISNSSVIKHSNKEEIFSCKNFVNISEVPKKICGTKPKLINNNVTDYKTESPNKETYSSEKLKLSFSNSSKLPRSETKVPKTIHSIKKTDLKPKKKTKLHFPKSNDLVSGCKTTRSTSINSDVKVSKSKVSKEINSTKQDLKFKYRTRSVSLKEKRDLEEANDNIKKITPRRKKLLHMPILNATYCDVNRNRPKRYNLRSYKKNSSDNLELQTKNSKLSLKLKFKCILERIKKREQKKILPKLKSIEKKKRVQRKRKIPEKKIKLINNFINSEKKIINLLEAGTPPKFKIVEAERIQYNRNKKTDIKLNVSFKLKVTHPNDESFLYTYHTEYPEVVKIYNDDDNNMLELSHANNSKENTDDNNANNKIKEKYETLKEQTMDKVYKRNISEFNNSNVSYNLEKNNAEIDPYVYLDNSHVDRVIEKLVNKPLSELNNSISSHIAKESNITRKPYVYLENIDKIIHNLKTKPMNKSKTPEPNNNEEGRISHEPDVYLNNMNLTKGIKRTRNQMLDKENNFNFLETENTGLNNSKNPEERRITLEPYVYSDAYLQNVEVDKMVKKLREQPASKMDKVVQFFQKKSVEMGDLLKTDSCALSRDKREENHDFLEDIVNEFDTFMNQNTYNLKLNNLDETSAKEAQIDKVFDKKKIIIYENLLLPSLDGAYDSSTSSDEEPRPKKRKILRSNDNTDKNQKYRSLPVNISLPGSSSTDLQGLKIFFSQGNGKYPMKQENLNATLKSKEKNDVKRILNFNLEKTIIEETVACKLSKTPIKNKCSFKNNAKLNLTIKNDLKSEITDSNSDICSSSSEDEISHQKHILQSKNTNNTNVESNVKNKEKSNTGNENHSKVEAAVYNSSQNSHQNSIKNNAKKSENYSKISDDQVIKNDIFEEKNTQKTKDILEDDIFFTSSNENSHRKENLTKAELYDLENNFSAIEGTSNIDKITNFSQKFINYTQNSTDTTITSSGEGADLIKPYQECQDSSQYDLWKKDPKLTKVWEDSNDSLSRDSLQSNKTIVETKINYLNVIKPLKKAPTRKEVMESLYLYDLKEINYQKPFYSDHNDVTAGIEVGCNVLKVLSKNTVHLDDFESLFEGLNDFRKVQMKNLNYNLDWNKNNVKKMKLMYCKGGTVVLEPLKKAPCRNDVEDWVEKRVKDREKKIFEEKIVKEKLFVPCGNDENSDSDENCLSLSISEASATQNSQENFKSANFISKKLNLTKDILEYSCQLSGASMENTFGFQENTVNDLQKARAVLEHQYLTVLIMELHFKTRGEFKPNPEHDPIRAIFYSILHDVPGENHAKLRKGVIAVDEHENILDGIPDNCTITYAPNEESLIHKFIELIDSFDPDIFAGYEIELLSWGYLIERANQLSINLLPLLSRTTDSNNRFRDDDFDELKIPGRIILNVWRLMRHEIALQSYTFENIVYNILHKRLYKLDFRELTFFWEHKSNIYRHRTVKYYLTRVVYIFELFDKLDLLGRTSELARLFGIQFYEVLSRGSQFRVESMMLRLAKPLNYVAVSPSTQQRAKMRAPEFIPLVMEPHSRFYVDPVVVLDFQSLYPSIMIAYNYCFSTCLGKVERLGKDTPFEFGTTQLKISRERLKRFVKKDLVNYSPCGVGFVKSKIREGILPRMLKEILDTRLMVKSSMKENKHDKVLQKVLHSRQLGLKLIANVTFGYTAANFSGRMPCVELGDSVVSKGRETLQRAIQFVEGTPEFGAKVAYGDTDSMFVVFPGKSREYAFETGRKIADEISKQNPDPVTLKFEKVYHPCILQTKKRYVGYMWESENQKEAIYEAKGIETVRRDGCPASVKLLEKCLRLLFDTKDISLIKKYVLRQFNKIISGKVSLQDLTFAKEYRGASGYKPGACVPAWELTKKWTAVDKRNEPRSGERVPYVIVNGPPGLPLIKLVRCPRDLLNDPSLRPNALYYITKVIIPPINRCLNLIGVNLFTWFNQMPRKQIQCLPTSSPGKKSTISQYFVTANCVSCGEQTNSGICADCSKNEQTTTVKLYEKLKKWERNHYEVKMICQSCTGYRTEPSCVSLDCPVMYRRIYTNKELQQCSFVRDLIEKEF